ncbi:uncharacterized protein V6R79_012148 [Siganus canaliculatus]
MQDNAVLERPERHQTCPTPPAQIYMACYEVPAHASLPKYMFVFFCIAEDAFKEHYFGELQSPSKALSSLERAEA